MSESDLILVKKLSYYDVNPADLGAMYLELEQAVLDELSMGRHEAVVTFKFDSWQKIITILVRRKREACQKQPN